MQTGDLPGPLILCKSVCLWCLSAHSGPPLAASQGLRLQTKLEMPIAAPRRLGMTLRVSAADPFGQLTGASVFVGGIALVKSRS